MALNSTQQNIAQSMRETAIALIELKPTMEAITKLWGTESLASLTDAEWAELSEFQGILASEMQAAKGALDGMLTALGDYDDSPVSDATKLLKITGKVP